MTHRVPELQYVSPIIEFVDNPPLLTCTGEEDRNTKGDRRRSLIQAFRADGDVIADLGELRFADTSLVFDLAILSNRLRRTDRTLVIRNAAPQIMYLIRLIGVHRLPGIRVEEPETAIA